MLCFLFFPFLVGFYHHVVWQQRNEKTQDPSITYRDVNCCRKNRLSSQCFLNKNYSVPDWIIPILLCLSTVCAPLLVLRYFYIHVQSHSQPDSNIISRQHILLISYFISSDLGQTALLQKYLLYLGLFQLLFSSSYFQTEAQETAQLIGPPLCNPAGRLLPVRAFSQVSLFWITQKKQGGSFLGTS